MSGIVIVVPVVYGTISAGTYRALVWGLAVATALLVGTFAVWGYMGFSDWLRRRR